MIVNTDWFFLSHRLPVALAAKEEGFRVNIISPDSGMADQIRSYGLNHNSVNLNRGTKNPFNDIIFFLQLVRILVKLNPAIVHNVTIKPIIYGTIAAKITGVGSVINAVSGLGSAFDTGKNKRILSKLMRILYKIIMNLRGVTVIVQNSRDESLFREILKHPQLIKTNGSGVELQKYNPINCDILNAEQKINVLFAGRLLKSKGIITYIEAIRELDSSIRSKANFLVAGMIDIDNRDGIPSESLKLWEQEGTVKYCGFVNEMETLLSKVSILVYPSYYKEGLPKILIEAGAMAIPVVTADSPGCNDIVEHNYNGLLTNPRDAYAVQQAMTLLISDSKLRLHLGNNNRKIVEQRYHIQKVVETHLRLYMKSLHT